MEDGHNYKVGEFLVEPSRNLVSQNGKSTAIEPKAMDLLMVLIDRAGHVVSNEEILETVWAGRVVEEATIYQRVSKIRQALGDSSRNPKYIENVPRRGYRLVAQTERLNQTATSAGLSRLLSRLLVPLLAFAVVIGIAVWLALTPAESQPDHGPAIYIEPMTLREPNEQFEWLVVGIRSDLTYQIDRFADYMQVGTPQKGIPENADFVLGGDIAIQPNGEVRVSARLTDMDQQKVVWAERFVGNVDDPGLVTDAISTRIVRFMRWDQEYSGLVPSRPEARKAFYKWQYNDFSGDPQVSMLHLNEAVRLEPTWALGRVLQAWDYFADMTPESIRKGQNALAEAKALGFNKHSQWISATAHNLWAFEGRFEDAESFMAQHIHHAQIRHGYAQLMMNSGLVQEANAYFEQLTVLEPWRPQTWFDLAITRGIIGDAQGAYDAIKKIESLTPPGTFNMVHSPALWVLPHSGHLDESLELLRYLESAEAKRIHGGWALFFSSNLRAEMARVDEDWQALRNLIDETINFGVYEKAAQWSLYLGEDLSAAEYYAKAPADDFWMYRMLNAWLHMFYGPEIMKHPLIAQRQAALGFTPDWQRTLCQRIQNLRATNPPIECNPANYAVADD